MTDLAGPICIHPECFRAERKDGEPRALSGVIVKATLRRCESGAPADT